MSNPVIEVNGLASGYVKGLNILQGVDLVLKENEVVSIIGPNGAGKSTLLKAIMGLIPIFGGKIYFKGNELLEIKSHELVKKRIAYVPQVSNVLQSLSIEENLEMGAFIRNDPISDSIAQVYDLFPILKQKRKQSAGELSGGQRQQVAVGRALMTQPKVLLLDEPTAGVSPIVMDELFDRIIEIARLNVAILMVEQNAKQALEIADRGYVLVQGLNRFTDTGEALLVNPEVRKAFLGG